MKPDQPRRQVEQELEVYARQRREEAGAPFELHPVNRRQLQDEVARTYGRAGGASEGWGWRFSRLIPRLATAAAVMVVLGVVLWNFRPLHQGPSYELARRDVGVASTSSATVAAETPAARPSEPPAAVAPSPLPPAASVGAASVAAEGVPAPEVRLERSAAGAKTFEEKKDRFASGGEAGNLSRGGTSGDRALVAGAEAVPRAETKAKLRAAAAPNRGTAPALAMAPTSKAESEGALSESRVPAAAPGADSRVVAGPSPLRQFQAVVQTPAPVDSVAVQTQSQGLTDSSQQQMQVFSQRQRYRRNVNSPPLPPVMQRFTFEQQGEVVRIIDSDGSIYDGQVLLAAAPSGGAGVAANQVQAGGFGGRANGAQNVAPDVSGQLAFRVAGSNLTLQLPVVFEGILDPATPVAQEPVEGNANRAEVQQNNQALNFGTPQALGNQRNDVAREAMIHGELRVGTQLRLQVEAGRSVP